ncbi:MAG TPA: HAD-IB family hydrolase [Jiangellaceae bacterium]|nr:HAD-IB family hydrolase [Jiangellaceae bacterium]
MTKSHERGTVEQGADQSPLRDAHILLTGVTGFLGQAILEKLLATYPSTRVSVLIRPRGSRSGQARLDALLGKPVFEQWRGRIGDDELRSEVARRVSVIEGGLDDGLQLPEDLDVVVHGASAVSFDSPIDEAFDDNVDGARALYEALLRTGTDPHVVHVSTAYVAGLRKGLVVEGPLAHDVGWRAEQSAATAARAEVEQESRHPEVLRELVEAERNKHGKAGPQAVTLAAEEARVEWVRSRLVDFGRTRAQSLGWPDSYTLTKALGERVAEQLWSAAGHRLSLVRPSIIESALRHPYPGWIDGFKVADPLIVAYGKGHLREFPGLPDSVLDVIPVDLVVAATLAVAASPPDASEPGYFQVTSGARNPLSYRRMYANAHSYFTAHPMPDGAGGHIQVPTWQFPGVRRVTRRLARNERLLGMAENSLGHLPASPRTRVWMGELQKRVNGLGALRNFADLYQSYTQTEVIYDDTNTYALHQTLPMDQRGQHGFDVADIDWEHYLQQVHMPGIAAIARAHSARKRSNAGSVSSAQSDRPVSSGDPGQHERELPHRSDVVAVFDLQGTVLDSNIIEQYLLTQLARLPRSRWPVELADLLRLLPRYVLADRRDRGEFIRDFVRRYAGTEEADLLKLVDGTFGDVLRRRVLPDALDRIEQHRAAGHHTVLVTGAIDVLVRPLGSYFDDVVAARMHSQNGHWTGYLDSPPLVDEARAAWLQQYARAHGLDLDASYAYGDSHADRVWLELVGHPQTVNPDLALYRHAKQKHWPIHAWDTPRRSRIDSLSGSLAARSDR